MVSIRRRILEKGNLIKEQFIRVLQEHEDRIVAVENGESGEAADITELKTIVGDEDSGLVKDVADLKTTKANANHNHTLTNVTDLATVEATVTYTDSSTETILLVKQVSS